MAGTTVLISVNTCRKISASVTLQADTKRLIASEVGIKANTARKISANIAVDTNTQRKVKEDLLAVTKVESIAITMSASSTFDTVSVVVPGNGAAYQNAMNFCGNYQGLPIEFVTERVRETRKATGKTWTLSGRSDATDFLYKPVDFTLSYSDDKLPTAAAICRALGIIVDFPDFTPTYSKNGWNYESGKARILDKSVQSVLGKLFSWSKGLGEKEIMYYQRGTQGYVIERQRVKNTYKLDAYKLDSLEIDSQLLVRATEQVYAETIDTAESKSGSANTPGKWIWVADEGDVPFTGSYKFGNASLTYKNGLLMMESTNHSVTDYEYKPVYKSVSEGTMFDIPLYQVLARKVVSEPDNVHPNKQTITVYNYDTYFSSESHLAVEATTVQSRQGSSDAWTVESQKTIEYVPLGDGFFGQTEYDSEDGAVATSISRGSPGGQASVYTIKRIIGATREKIDQGSGNSGDENSNDTTIPQYLNGIPINYVTIPIAESDYVGRVIDQMNKMNGIKEIRLTASIPGGDLFDARCGAISFEGKLYYIDSNTVSGNATALRRQSLSAVRWE